MTFLALIRHGTTEWNDEGLIQGSSDVSLSAEGIAEVKGWVLPGFLADYLWLSSPLKRARETAKLLIGRTPPTDPRLTEMCWGAWEGRTLQGLRDEIGPLMVAWEARGLDFRGPGGESPRDVQARTRMLFTELAAAGRPTAAVVHRGLIRAVYASATGWDMADKAPDKLLDHCVQLFDLDTDGMPHIRELNISLAP